MMRLGFVATFLLAAPLAVRAEDAVDPVRPALEAAVAKVKPALVRIEAVWARDYQGREVKYEASGSGVIISKKGHVLTNHHVAGRATRLVCVLAHNEEIEAVLVGTDALADLSVLQLRGKDGAEYPAVEFGDSSAVKVGDTVLAMGSPLALSQSVTRGIISNTKMVMPGSFRNIERFTLDGEDVGALVRWIAHDAAIFPGNSGGPLVNLNGEIIGINEISFGLGGAIPSNLARPIAEQLIERGKVRRSWLGLEIQPLLKSEPLESGALIGGTIEGSPAAKAGLKSGDILLRLNGKAVSVRFGEEVPLLNQMVASIPIGSEVEAVVQRGDKEMVFKITTTEREPMQPNAEELKQWGMTARNISSLAAREMKLDNQDGVLVTSVRPGGPCGDAKPSIQPRDVIKAVNDRPVKNFEQLEALTQELTKTKTAPMPVLVRFDRKTEQFLTVVNVGLKEFEDPGLEARKAWLPAELQVVTSQMAAQLGTNGLNGVRVTQVYSNSTASAAGLRIGDVIMELDGEKVVASQLGDEETFTSRIRQYRVGAKPEFQILRDGKVLTLAIELALSPKLEREMKRFQDSNFEFTARDVSFFDKVREELPEDFRGTLVMEVKDGGWAALGNLAVGDLLLEVGGETLADVKALEKKMKQVAAQKPKYVVLRVLRGIHTRYLELEPNWDDNKRARKENR